MLYGKQSYTGVPACEYPAGYVEPYPRFFSTLRSFAETALKHLGVAHDFSRDPNRNKEFRYVKAKQRDYFRRLARILEVLGVRGPKGSNAEPLTAEEHALSSGRSTGEAACAGEWESPSIRRLVLRFALQHARRINVRCRRYPLG